MRIVGLPEFSGAIVRRDAAVIPAAKVHSARAVNSQQHEAETPIAASHLSAGRDVPIDQDRVAEIRRALETGTYPLLPTKIADAIIAAGLYGKVGK